MRLFFSRYLCVLKGFSFPFLLKVLFIFDPDQDLGVAKPRVAFLLLSIFSFLPPPSLLANTEKEALSLELFQRALSASICTLLLNTNNFVSWAPLRAAREVQRQTAGWRCPLPPGSKVKGCYSSLDDASWLKETPSDYSHTIDWVIRVSVFQYLALYNPIL